MPSLRSTLSAVALLLGAAAVRYWLISPPRVLSASDPVLDLYVGNGPALKVHPVPVDPVVVQQLNNSPVGSLYANRFDPRLSVFLSDCSGVWPWCGDPSFQFDSVFNEAANLAGAAPDTLLTQWLGAADQTDELLKPQFNPASAAEAAKNLQLLAIANRMDLAHVTASGRSGGEIHFLYGKCASQPEGPCPPAQIHVIVEFVIPDLPEKQFAALAQQWMSLSSLTGSSTAYRTALLKAFAMSGFSRLTGEPPIPGVPPLAGLRIRINHAIGGGWRLSQTQLQGKAFAQTGLPFQLPNGFDTNGFSPADYRTLWNQALAFPGDITLFQIPNTITDRPAPSSIAYQDSCALGTPTGDSTDEPVRSSLAIQQCSLCHTTETGTSFVHVVNRDPTGSSTLSSFLAGTKGQNIYPSLSDLYYGNPTVLPVITVKYGVYTPAACPGTAPNSVSHQFHDIARRSLFLAETVANAASGTGAGRSNKKGTKGETTGSVPDHFSTRFIE